MYEDIFLHVILPHVCVLEWGRCSCVNVASRAYVAEKRDNAALILQRWLVAHQLPPEEHPIYTRSLPSHRILVRTYMARYPREHIRSMIHIIPHKLRRLDLVREGPWTARTLRSQLQAMSPRDIFFVGW